MATIQSRFEVAISELPEHIDPASYSEYLTLSRFLLYMFLTSGIIFTVTS